MPRIIEAILPLRRKVNARILLANLSAEDCASHMPLLKVQEPEASNAAIAAVSRGNRFANSIRPLNAHRLLCLLIRPEVSNNSVQKACQVPHRGKGFWTYQKRTRRARQQVIAALLPGLYALQHLRSVHALVASLCTIIGGQ